MHYGRRSTWSETQKNRSGGWNGFFASFFDCLQEMRLAVIRHDSMVMAFRQSHADSGETDRFMTLVVSLLLIQRPPPNDL